MSRKFLKIECPGCGYRQSIFVRPAIKIKCNSCGSLLAEPTGGIGNFKGRLTK